MKNITIYIMFLLPLLLYSASLSHQEITNMVSKIKDERAGISLDILEKTPNPFAIIEKVVEKEVEEIKVEKPKEIIPQEVYNITAVLNHAGFINKKWYRVGDKIGSYTVVHIEKSSATLKRGKEYKRLVIPRKKKKFKIFKGD
ncbi:MAG TPA: hypothetical protein ENK79_00150 [Campylobacterales bacterium]|nr:hypothetical protein [Campylobacterales bacterium]